MKFSKTIQSVLTMLKDAETGQRGYLLTHDERYLEPYHAAFPEIVTTIEPNDDSPQVETSAE